VELRCVVAKSTLERLGAELRARRLECRLTQDELAAKAGLHRNFIGLIERGERNLTVLSLEAITDVLGVTMAEVLGAAERRRKAK
jgi:transcriptional regulator with XRE-family HTH domain